MRRFVLLMCAGAAALLLASGAVWAIEPPWPKPTKECDRGGGLCVGTAHRDAIYGSKAADDIRARAGHDFAHARPGNDAAYGGPGRDDLRGGADRDDLHGGGGGGWVG